MSLLFTRSYITNLNVEENSLDSLALLYVQLEGIINGFEKNNFIIPDYLIEKFNEFKLELDIRMRSDKLRRLKILKAQRENLKTKDELRSQKDSEIAALEKELNG